MSVGAAESLPLERVEGGADLFDISGGGREDMVVEGRTARRVGLWQMRFLTDRLSSLGTAQLDVAPTLCHVPSSTEQVPSR